MTEAQGEKELILGNKQLISLFFVVVALCGVCFAMGYIIGRNTSKAAVAVDAPAASAPAAAPAQDAEPPREASQAPADSGSPAAQDSSAATPADASASTAAATAPAAGDQVTTQPVRDVPEPAAQSAAPQTAGGSYLQVGAVSRGDAENLVKTLREQKLPALMSESPKKGLYRVLVGPYHQTTDLADAKARLKTLGFDNAFVQK
jgi:DedD protein